MRTSHTIDERIEKRAQELLQKAEGDDGLYEYWDAIYDAEMEICPNSHLD